MSRNANVITLSRNNSKGMEKDRIIRSESSYIEIIKGIDRCEIVNKLHYMKNKFLSIFNREFNNTINNAIK